MHFLKKKYHTGGKRWQKTTSWEFFPHPSLAKIVTTVQICVTMHLGAVRLKRGGLTARGGAYNKGDGVCVVLLLLLMLIRILRHC